MSKAKHARKRNLFHKNRKARQVYIDALFATFIIDAWYAFVVFFFGGEFDHHDLKEMLPYQLPLWLVMVFGIAISRATDEYKRERATRTLGR